ncbi:hypothetical protein ACIA8K_27330 [Catenuloplanes sp. NPDC051500]|uniref:LppU/SCO3897 family protein n=1 Tax=Catenuloplanes sp. NPDC051500 TaxID=3363959 RepID=UPI0037BBA09F
MTDQPAGFPPPQHNSGFGAPGAPQYGQPQQGQPQFGQPQQGQPQYGQPQQGFGAAPQDQAGFGAAPGQPVSGVPGQPAYGAPGQPAFGAPGQQAYGAPAFGAPGQPPAFGAPGSYTPDEPKKGGKGRLAGILGVVGVVGIGILIKVVIGLGIGAGAAAAGLYDDPTANAKVGDCLDDTPELKEGQEGSANNVGLVACTDADATSVIIGRVDNLTLIQAQDEEQCYSFVQEGESFTMLWPTQADANKYYVLCLKDK